MDSDAAFKEKLRNMGKVSKRKFTQLARLFSGRNKRNFKQLDESSSKDYYYDDLNDTTAASSSSNFIDGHGNNAEKFKKTNIKF